MEDKVYWKGLEELEQTSQQNDREFADELPVLGSIIEPITTGSTSRRDFLKMLGFSTTAAVIAAGCEMPVRKSIPYALKPEEVIPGVPNYYASAMYEGGDYCSVLVKTREGRPIKIEGNKMSSVTKGATSARAQASVISMYDGARYKSPKRGKENITWDVADKEIGEKLKAISDAKGKIVIYSSSIPSPSTLGAINEFKSAYGATHLVSDAVSYSGILDAHDMDDRGIPCYHFDKAELIVGIGCDFLGTWLSPIEFAADWSVNRKVSKDNKKMSRHIQIEAILTNTGASADTRIPVKPGEEATYVADLYKALSGSPSGNAKMDEVAKELMANKGKSLVVSGSNDVNVQKVVLAINYLLGNFGTTISESQVYKTKTGSDKATAELVDGLNSGDIKAVIFYNSNPLHTCRNADKLAEGLKKAALSVSFSERLDETSEACQYICPDNNWLESWNDVSPKTGVYNICQPTISKLFDTRQAQETLLKWSGNKDANYYDFIRAYWEKTLYPKQSKFKGFNALWDVTVHDGELVIENAAQSGKDKGTPNGFVLMGVANNAEKACDAIKSSYSNLGDTQLKVYESVGVGGGHWADNPYLQELPDPITKVTWDNYVIIPVSFRRKNNIKNDLELKEYQMVKVTANGQSVTLPAVAVPGVADGSFGIALGYGRTAVNNKDLKVGQNAYPLLTMMGDNLSYITKATIEVLSDVHQVAITQSHHNITLRDLGGVKKRKIVKETTLPEYQKNEFAGNEDRAEILEEMITLYYEHEKAGHHWNMSVDLNSCMGCGACVTACNIENNVPVVGKDQVRRSREMHWLRIDRYFTYTEMLQDATDPTNSETKDGQKPIAPESVDIVFQPLMCQHCDNAPCENVCPVSATTHSSEGLNQMTYNRCIGTRYCANNCPYKVRRFNWYDYQAADAFDGKRVGKFWANEGLLSSITQSLQEPLARMVLNPDVTVRSRGVMEKCSFCVQRIQEGKLNAKKDNRPLKDGDIVTACQAACPTNAIVFGDKNDKASEIVTKVMDKRTYGVIEEIHTMPNVTYLTKVRNREEAKA